MDTRKTVKLNKQLVAELTLAIDKACTLIADQDVLHSQFYDTVKAEKSDCKQALRRAYNSTVIFAQYEAGTGVCISSSGLILTCAHCCDDGSTSRRSSRSPPKKFVLFADGSIYLTQVLKLDFQMDVGLLQVIGVYDSITCSVYQVDTGVIPDPARLLDSIDQNGRPDCRQCQDLNPTDSIDSINSGGGKKKKSSSPEEASSVATSDRFSISLPFTVLADDLVHDERLFCLGQPGRDDLESEEARKTDYPLIHISKGRFQRCLSEDLCDNREIGQLQHSCWTYWGHSGAPLINSRGQVAGLHSSWDDETQTRHGVHVAALKTFFETIEIN